MGEIPLATGYWPLPTLRTETRDRIGSARGESIPSLMDRLPGGNALPEGDLTTRDAVRSLVRGEDAIAGEEPAIVAESFEIIGARVRLVEAEARCPPLRHALRQTPARECADMESKRRVLHARISEVERGTDRIEGKIRNVERRGRRIAMPISTRAKHDHRFDIA